MEVENALRERKLINYYKAYRTDQRDNNMLDTFGKISDRIIHNNIEAVSGHFLGSNQYALKNIRLTVDTINEVMNMAQEDIFGMRWIKDGKKYCPLAALSLKNALQLAW